MPPGARKRRQILLYEESTDVCAQTTLKALWEETDTHSSNLPRYVDLGDPVITSSPKSGRSDPCRANNCCCSSAAIDVRRHSHNRAQRENVCWRHQILEGCQARRVSGACARYPGSVAGGAPWWVPSTVVNTVEPRPNVPCNIEDVRRRDVHKRISQRAAHLLLHKTSGLGVLPTRTSATLCDTTRAQYASDRGTTSNGTPACSQTCRPILRKL